jgi:nucleoside-diphosphate-sugar epimerase
MSNITVYGATGYIGSFFAETFKNEIIIQKREDLKPKSKKVLYLISTTDNYNVLNNSFIDIETNLIHLMKVLDECKEQDIEFTFISSWFVYGDTELPANETSPCKPKGFYSITKYAAEMLLESFCKTHNIKYKIIRLGNVIGFCDNSGSKKKNALQYLLHELKKGNDINLYNDGAFYRDYIDIRDVVEGIKFIIDKGPENEIFNLASGNKQIFKEIIYYAQSKLKSNSKINSIKPTNFHKIVQVESMYLDTTKIKDLGFKCKYSIWDTINSMLY